MVNWSGGAQGAAGGAMAGSMFGPWGTAIGAGVGGLAGLFGGDGGEGEAAENRKRQLALYEELSRGQPERAGYSDFRRNQKDYIATLEAQAAGRGPSVATETMKAATDRSAARAQGLAQSGTGNQAAAMMMAQEASGQMGAQNSQAASAMRAQEQLNAQQLLGINLHGARGADEDMNRFNASQGNNYGLQNNQLRSYLLGSTGGQIPRGPMMGEQILAGGAGMYGQYKQMEMLKAGQKPGYQTWTNPNAGPRY